MTDTVVIVERAVQTVAVAGAAAVLVARQESVQVLTAGTQGPAGAPGASGFSQTFGTPALSWVVNHNLGRFPILQILSMGNVEIEAEVVHVSVNQLVIYFAGLQAGRVIAL